ncbi:MAG: outer membrane protein [Candidatus Korobacteraceae bacterium]
MCLLLMASAASVSAQSIELAIGAGGYLPVNHRLADTAVALQGTFSARLLALPLVSLHFDLPIVGTLNSTVTSTQQLTSAGTYSAMFIAPGLKLKLAPEFPITPYIAGGVGIARFSKSGSLVPAGGDNVTNTNVFDFGLGMDAKIAPYLSLRGEFRDFYSGNAQLRLSDLDERQHNLVITGGLVLRF